MSWKLCATCTRGLEETVRAELVGLGHGGAEVGRGAVTFAGDATAVMQANLWLRTAMRVLVVLAQGPARSREELYLLARSVHWEEYVGRDQSVAVDVAGRSQSFASTAFAALTVKDAIVDRLRERRGARPDIDRTRPDVRIHLHLRGTQAALALDSSGEPLSHRGYRPAGGPAPLAEPLAAGVLMLAGYDGTRPLVDPMCGTGTIAIEGALIASRTAPGLRRPFACERWRFFPTRAAAHLREEARALRRRPEAEIVASDADERAVAATARNAREAGVGTWLTVDRRDVRDLAVPGGGSLVVCNPPYGKRVGAGADLAPVYRQLGDTLKRRAAGCSAWLLVGDLALAKAIGLRAQRRIVLFNGPLECRLLRFDLVAGAGPGAGG